MQVVYIVLLLYRIINAENNESKLIDLLPEKEKEDFLDNIARRILEEVQSKDDSHKASGELSDDQLNQHDEYVKKILKEESQNLRKSIESSTKAAEMITVASTDKKDVVRSEDRYIDLTLRTDHRNKRENGRRIFQGYSPESDQHIKLSNGSDAELDIQVKNFRRNVENVETTISKEIDVTTHSEYFSGEINNSTIYEHEIQNKITKNMSEDEDNDKYWEIKGNSQGNPVNKNNKSVESTTVTEVTIESSENTTSAIVNNHNVFINEEPKAEETQTLESGNPIILRSYEENVDLNENSSISKVTITTDRLEESKVINITITDDRAIETAIPSVKTEVLTTTLSPATNKIIKTNVQTYKKPEEHNNAEIFLSPDMIHSNANVEKIQGLLNLYHNNQNSKKFPIARHNALEEDIINKQDLHFNELKEQYEKNKIKAYEVYEISPDASPFVKQDKPKIKLEATKKPITDEQPYYIPVYNYKPENAFFDGHNIYGINSDSEKDKDFYSINNHNDKNKNKNKDKNLYNLIYNYSPDNAFYNSHNVYGPNVEANNEKKDYKIKDDDDIDTHTIENIDDNTDIQLIKNDDVDVNKNSFQWDYYFFNDPLRKLQLDATPEISKKGLNNHPGRMGVKDPKHFNCGKTACDLNSYEQTTETPECNTPTEFDPLFTNHKNPEYLGDSIRQIKKIMLEQKVFSFIKPPEHHFDLNHELNELKAKELKKLLREKKTTPRKDTQHKSFQRYKNDDTIEKIDLNKTRDISVEFYNILKFIDASDKPYQPVIPVYSDKNIERNKDTDTHSKEIDLNTIKKIIDIVPSGKDVVTTLLKLLELSKQKKSQRTQEHKEIDNIVPVLGDMVKENNKALVNYAWLETAVDLQSAIKKMADLVDGVKKGDNIHPSDMELLKYLVYLHTYAKESQQQKKQVFTERSRGLLPKSKKKKGIITESGLLNRVWLIRKAEIKHLIRRYELEHFEEFLDDLQAALYDLHIALKYIAMVTTSKNQKWYENLKFIYVGSDRKQLLQIMLHLWTTRLLGLVEETAKNGLEDDYLTYVNKNEKEVDMTKKECAFVLSLIEEIKRSK